MGLLRRGEILVHPQVNLHTPALEPAASSGIQVRRLCDLWDAQEAVIEGSGIILTTSRHG